MGRFAVVCRSSDLKFDAEKIKVALNGEPGLKREVHVDRMRLEHASQVKCLGCDLNESGTDVESRRKMASRRKFPGVIGSYLSMQGCCMKHYSCLF